MIDIPYKTGDAIKIIFIFCRFLTSMTPTTKLSFPISIPIKLLYTSISASKLMFTIVSERANAAHSTIQTFREQG
jgi:hypothetical protein